jgi:phosphoserine phosphatase
MRAERSRRNLPNGLPSSILTAACRNVQSLPRTAGGSPDRSPVPALSGDRSARPRVSTVLFDCDSTLCAIEGIQYISRDNAEVEALTRAAMNGDVPLEAVYGERLARVRPGRGVLDRLGQEYIATLMPDAREVVVALLHEGIRVRIISGGLLPAVRILGHELGLGDADIAAVGVNFDPAGEYAGYDESSPLARAGGKRELVEAWRAELPAPILLVGDGATDAEAAPALDVFVAYCGVAERPGVVAKADHVITSESLAPVLPLALGEDAPTRPDSMPLHERGQSLLAHARSPI